MRNLILRASQERNGNMSGLSPIWNVAILASFRVSFILAFGWQEANNMDPLCYVQGSAKGRPLNLVNFVIALIATQLPCSIHAT